MRYELKVQRKQENGEESALDLWEEKMDQDYYKFHPRQYERIKPPRRKQYSDEEIQKRILGLDKFARDFPVRMAKLIKEVCPPKMNYTLRGELEKIGLNENGRLKVQFVFIKTTYIQKVQKKEV